MLDIYGDVQELQGSKPKAIEMYSDLLYFSVMVDGNKPF